MVTGQEESLQFYQFRVLFHGVNLAFWDPFSDASEEARKLEKDLSTFLANNRRNRPSTEDALLIGNRWLASSRRLANLKTHPQDPPPASSYQHLYHRLPH